MITEILERITHPDQASDDVIWYVPYYGHAALYATPEEVQTIVLPYESYIRTLPGCLGLSALHNETELDVRITFDTKDHAEAAKELLYGNTKPEVVTAAEALIVKYNNRSYTSNTQIICY